MVMHRLRRGKGGRFAFSECNRALHIVGGKAVKTWENVTCKNCLKHRMGLKKESEQDG